MKWIQDGRWHKWFAWKRVLVPGIAGESDPKIVWLEIVERRTIVNRGATKTDSPYVTYEYREHNPGLAKSK